MTRVPVEQAIARKIRELRQAAGWSQDEMARRMAAAGWSWHPQTVQRIERCQRHVRLAELADLGVIFGVTFLADFEAPGAAAMRNVLERELREQIAAEILAGLKPDLRIAGTGAA